MLFSTLALVGCACGAVGFVGGLLTARPWTQLRQQNRLQKVVAFLRAHDRDGVLSAQPPRRDLGTITIWLHNYGAPVQGVVLRMAPDGTTIEFVGQRPELDRLRPLLRDWRDATIILLDAQHLFSGASS